MWTARAPVSFGPRPGEENNVICIDYFESYSPEEQDIILNAYSHLRGYTTAPMGPIVDPGYHGQLPSCDWRSPEGFNFYLDAASKLERAGVHVNHFLRPDRGVAGLEWTVEDLDRELGPYFKTARAQRTMRIVTLGWEPGPRYYYNNDWWVEMCQWMARTFPDALRLVHMVADLDAPAGGDDDKRGITNGKAWQNIAPLIHGWLVQNAGYTNSGNPVPSPDFLREFTNQFRPDFRGSLIERFTTGGPTGDWPTSSAWGEGKRLRVYAGEFAAYANYWQNWPEYESRYLGAQAIKAGADGVFDGVY